MQGNGGDKSGTERNEGTEEDVDDDEDNHEVVDRLVRQLPEARSLPLLPTTGEVFGTGDSVADADDVDVESELVLAAILESTVPLR